MARLRHIAITTQDPEKACRFYADVFGMTIIRKTERPTHLGYILTDGHINLAILKFYDDGAAGQELGAGYTGLHHIGFQVDDVEEAAQKVIAAGGRSRADIDEAQGGHRYAGKGGGEFKYSSPDGVIFDLSQGGWKTSPD